MRNDFEALAPMTIVVGEAKSQLPGRRHADALGRLLAGGALPALGLAILFGGLFVTSRLYASGQLILAVACLAVLCLGVFVYLSPRASAWRFLFPGLVVAAVFVVLPIAYTVSLSVTNYSSQNLLSFERATDYLLSLRYLPAAAQRYSFALLPEGKGFRARLEGESGEVFLSERFVPGTVSRPIGALRDDRVASGSAVGTALLLQHLAPLKTLSVRLPDGSIARMSDLRSFDASQPLYRQNPDASLSNAQDGSVIRPNRVSGYYETAAGERVPPGFTVPVGAAQYRKLITDDGLSQPFVRIFAWTFAYAALTVLLSFVAGLVLAVLLSWQELRWRETYKLLYYLPSAVPMMIAVLIIQRMFYTNTGEVNAVLQGVFGIRPDWLATPSLARAMVVIVSVWVFFPFMMMLCIGLIRAIPAELYEASALAGAGPRINFFRITLPLVARPALPVLIAAFASTFNNAGLIVYLTDGHPTYLDTREPMGMTDLLASATYRIAFFNGSNFGLAAAITVLLFLIVALLAFASLRLTKAQYD